MAGTKKGGLRAAATNKARHGKDFYAKIGSTGGKNGHTGGFAAAIICNCEWVKLPHKKAQCAGTRGGSVSRRTKVIKHEDAS